jgi:hypothetical protein
MDNVNASPVVTIDDRRRSMSRALAARRQLDRAPFPSDQRRARSRARGRVWVNGVELGGTDPRHSTLALSYD